MGWGTNYKYHGYLSHINKDGIPDKLEDDNKCIESIWREILAYAASTPPVQIPAAYEDEEPEMYPEFIARKLNSLRQDLEEYYEEKHQLEECIETMNEHPEEVSE